MCILFIAVTSDSHQVDGNYKLILAANRDEYYHRPAKVADYWAEDPNIVGGRDMEPGREGGTWLGMHKSGKLGVLLNILIDHPDPNKKGRGFLVNDYLKSPDLDGFQYSTQLKNDSHLYNGFNFVTVNVKDPEPTVVCFSSPAKDIAKLKHSGTLISAFGNSSIENPFLKVSDGKDHMEKLISMFPKKSQKDDLISGLLDILKSKNQFHPDPQMHKQVEDLVLLKGMSSRYVEIPSLNYGSRTHTVILVDFENKVEFHEWTMEEPIVSPENAKWIHSKYEFTLT